MPIVQPIILAQDRQPLSFAVISDTHFENHAGDGARVKVPRTLRNITKYGQLDALAVVGDLTNYGTAEEYGMLVDVFTDPDNFTNPVEKLLFVAGDHDWYNADSRENYMKGLSAFSDGESYPFHTYNVIKGYPFITLSVMNDNGNDTQDSSKGSRNYPQESLNLLESYLKKASKECPGKPIFFFTHVLPHATAYGSWPEKETGNGWCMKVLNPILNRYPQIIAFCGHSHYPIGDPRSIHQGTNPGSDRQNFYTVVGTGSTTYSEINPEAVNRGIHPWRFDEVTEGLLVDELPNGDIMIRRYDTCRDVEIDSEHRWVVKAPFDGSTFEYGDIRDADDNPKGVSLRDGLPAPDFPEDAELKAEAVADEVNIIVPQAIDNECVFRYGVKLYQSGNLISENFFFSQFYLNTGKPNEIRCTIGGLEPASQYDVEVTAYDSYDNKSAPITTVFTTAAETGIDTAAPTPYFNWTFNNPEHLLLSENCYASITPANISNTGEVILRTRAEDAGITPIEPDERGKGGIRVPRNAALWVKLYKADSNKNYTVLLDIKVSDPDSYNALFQTSLENGDDAECFIGGRQIGIGEIGYGGTISADRWHRVVLVRKDGYFKIYLDGILINTGFLLRCLLDQYGFLLLADDNSERVDTDLSQIAYWDFALTDGQVYKLGNSEIPTSINDNLIVDKSNVVSATGKPAYYDLLGRCVNKPSKGIYIMDGKLIDIK